MIIYGKDKKHADWNEMSRFEAVYLIASILLEKNGGHLEVSADEAFKHLGKGIELSVIPEGERYRADLIDTVICFHDTRRARGLVRKLKVK
jgi:hypothetical protein